jgi:hypothetical protein
LWWLYARKTRYHDEDSFLGRIEYFRKGIHVIMTVDMPKPQISMRTRYEDVGSAPFNEIIRSLSGEAVESMTCVDLFSQLVLSYLVRIIVTAWPQKFSARGLGLGWSLTIWIPRSYRVYVRWEMRYRTEGHTDDFSASMFCNGRNASDSISDGLEERHGGLKPRNVCREIEWPNRNALIIKSGRVAFLGIYRLSLSLMSFHQLCGPPKWPPPFCLFRLSIRKTLHDKLII